MKYFLIGTCLLLVGLCFMNYTLYKSSKNIRFVDTAYLYNNFKLKKELETTFNEIKALKQKQLDSLYDVINTTKRAVAGQDVRALESNYLSLRRDMSETQENLRQSYDTQIWTQINKYIKDFGEENKIDLIMGANGQGSVMHGEPDMNISEDVSNFINTKYSGK